MSEFDFYDNICEVHIKTEGYQCGYMVRVEDFESGPTVYHLSKSEFIGLLKKVHETVVSNGETDGWEERWS
jgi:hypothetical protein